MHQLKTATAWTQDCVLLVLSWPGSRKLKKSSSKKQCSSFSHVIPVGFNELWTFILVCSAGRTQISNSKMHCPEPILHHTLKIAPHFSISQTWSGVFYGAAVSNLLFPAFGISSVSSFYKLFFCPCLWYHWLLVGIAPMDEYWGKWVLLWYYL